MGWGLSAWSLSLMCVYIYIYTHTYIHTHIHICIHTYIHVYIYIYIYILIIITITTTIIIIIISPGACARQVVGPSLGELLSLKQTTFEQRHNKHAYDFFILKKTYFVAWHSFAFWNIYDVCITLPPFVFAEPKSDTKSDTQVGHRIGPKSALRPKRGDVRPVRLLRVWISENLTQADS